MTNEKELIARRIAQELKDGYVVNLGIGLPTMVSNYIPEGVDVLLQSENGIIRMGPAPHPSKVDKNIANAGAQPVTVLPGGAFFDSALSFAIIRGGHVDVTVLGALEIDESGSLASHIVPGKMASGMGGAMDLVVGSKKVIVATTHTQKDGTPKIVTKCTLPLTAVSKVNLIVTELAVILVTEEGFLLTEIAEGLSTRDLQAVTDARLLLSPSLKSIPR